MGRLRKTAHRDKAKVVALRVVKVSEVLVVLVVPVVRAAKDRVAKAAFVRR